MTNDNLKFSRRTFLASASAATIAGSGLTRAWAGGAGVAKKYDVVVVGAGLSGLHTAEVLEQEGFSVAIVEASDRVGGRLRTGRTDEYRAELGGSEVGVYYGRVRDACARLNVGLHTEGPQMTYFTLNVGGKMVNPADWENSDVNHMQGKERAIQPYLLQNKLFFDWLPFEDPADWLNPEYMSHDVSAAAYMRARGVSEAAIRLADFDLNGPSLDAISAMTIFRDLARIKMEGFNNPDKPQYGKNDETKQAYIVGGSDMLPKAMANALKADVRLNTPVVAVEQTGNEVETRLASGERLRSRFMVMAAPFSAVKNIHFNPGLPFDQANAVQGSMYSAATQFHFLITRPFWEEDGLAESMWSDRLFERTFVLKNGGGDYDSLIVWLNGDGASKLNAMDMKTQLAVIMRELEAARPSLKGALKPTISYSWEKNPFVGGNKHVFGAGQVKSFAKNMGRPHGLIHFAGEHLRRMDPGMESAMETAEIASLEVLDRL